MGKTLKRWCLLLLATVTVVAGAGCFGVSQNPSYFPFLLPTGDIIRTHAKPGGVGYFKNFDPHACRLEVRPKEATNPVRTQHVLIATVYDGDGQPRRNRRVEWILEGVGNIIEVDESGRFPGRGYKVDNHYAVSYTDYCEHQITRGNDNPNDDFMIRPGQSWCVISSAVEGDTHVTVYCPEIYNWDNHKVFVTKHWVDAEWIFPKPAINRAGTTHVFTTRIFRHTDKQPLANYRVRYKILDGPPAYFMGNRGQEEVVQSDLNGEANVTLAQVAPVMGINRIGVEIIRAPDPSTPSGVGIVIGRGETHKEWQAPQVQLAKSGPPSAAVGSEVPYNITVTNVGKVESKSLTVRDLIPEGMEFVRSDPPAAREGTELIWTLGELPAGESRTIAVLMKALRPGRVVNIARVITEEGLKDEKSVTTEITTPQLKVAKKGPETGVIGLPIAYDIVVSNPGGGPATNVMLRDEFDRGLEHESKPATNSVELTVGTLAPGESKTIRLTLTPRVNGTLTNRVTAMADGGLTDRSEHRVNVQEAKLAVRKTGPAASYVGRPVTWTLQVTNPGEVALNNVQVRDLLPAELTFESATDNGQLNNGQVVWSLGTLQPRETRTVQVQTKAATMTPQAVNEAVASADPGLEAKDRAAVEIRGLPAFRLEVVDLDDPIEVGAKTIYKIDVTNQGSLPGNQVKIVATVPVQMKVLNVKGAKDKPPITAGNTVTFPPIDSLGPREQLSYEIEVQAVQAGDVRFRASLTSSTLGEPVIEEESTNIFAPAPGGAAVPGPGPAAPAPPPAGGGPLPGPFPESPEPAPAPVPPAPPPPSPPGLGAATPTRNPVSRVSFPAVPQPPTRTGPPQPLSVNVQNNSRPITTVTPVRAVPR